MVEPMLMTVIGPFIKLFTVDSSLFQTSQLKYPILGVRDMSYISNLLVIYNQNDIYFGLLNLSQILNSKNHLEDIYKMVRHVLDVRPATF